MRSLLAYCLDNIPKGYFSTYLIESLRLGECGALEIEIMSIKTQKSLIINAKAIAFNEAIKIVIFHYRSYHYEKFRIGNKLFVYGSIQTESKNAHNKILINPKIVTEINTIKVIFKTRGINLNSLQKYISIESLLATNIGENYAKYIYEIFHPDIRFFKEYNIANSMPPNHIKAIKFIEIFLYIERLRSKKIRFQSKFQCMGNLHDFSENLPFSLTKAQQNAINDIARDLSSNIAARRVIMGDVGCGKTMVILASVILAYPQKSILMTPTSILAEQIYSEARKYLPSYIKIICITSSNSKKSDINADFIIGTQAILYKESDFSEFALVMTDEQHRFGTSVRTKLEKMLESKSATNTKKPHNLQFSATPIPRTMAMLQNNMLDFSFIKDLPFKKDITTYIIDKSGVSMLIARIKEEIALNNQVAIIYPKINEGVTEGISNDIAKRGNIPYMPLNEAKGYWEKNFNNVFSTYGKDKDKEEVLEQFRQTSGAILLATTMIEVGISLPRLTIIVIVGAERLGLASLHQLRGRVSRNGAKGYCYLYTNDTNNERLRRFSQTLSGFDIAELDLHYRNSGDLLDGIAQSGDNFNYFSIKDDIKILQEAKQRLDSIKNTNN